MPKFVAADVIAVILIIGCFILVGLGKNGAVDITLASVAGAYGLGRLVVPKIKKK